MLYYLRKHKKFSNYMTVKKNKTIRLRNTRKLKTINDLQVLLQNHLS